MLESMDRLLRWFIQGWIAIAILVNIIAGVGMFVAGGFWGGLAQLQETFSPFNVANYIMEVVLISPALAAHWWLERRQHGRLARYD